MPAARLAQSVERKALNLVVVGSSLTVGALAIIQWQQLFSLLIGTEPLTLWSWVRAPRWVPLPLYNGNSSAHFSLALTGHVLMQSRTETQCI